jgi:hypothetical protein
MKAISTAAVGVPRPVDGNAWTGDTVALVVVDWATEVFEPVVGGVFGVVVGAVVLVGAAVVVVTG